MSIVVDAEIGVGLHAAKLHILETTVLVNTGSRISILLSMVHTFWNVSHTAWPTVVGVACSGKEMKASTIIIIFTIMSPRVR